MPASARPGENSRVKHSAFVLLLVILVATDPTLASESSRTSPVISSEFIAETPPTPSCHASTIVQTKHGLVAAWFGGTHEGNSDVAIYVSRQVNERWEAPVEVANGDGFAKGRFPTWNPVLFQPSGGSLMLLYKVGSHPATWWGMLMTSDDEGMSWSRAHRLPRGIVGPAKNKCVQLAGSEVLCGSSTEGVGGWRVHFERTRDFGRTWSATLPVNDGVKIQAIQPSLLFTGDQGLLALGRTRSGRIFQIESPDLGVHWGAMRLLDLPNPDSGIDAVTLRDGRQLVVYNHRERGDSLEQSRSPLNVAVSPDGEHWFAALVLEDDPAAPSGFSYPAVIQTSDGMVHITYTWQRKRIRHVVLDPEKFELEAIVGGVWPR